MKEVINTLTAASGGASLSGAASGQLIIGGIGLFFMFIFGVWGAIMSYRSNKLIKQALQNGDIASAIRIKAKVK